MKSYYQEQLEKHPEALENSVYERGCEGKVKLPHGASAAVHRADRKDKTQWFSYGKKSKNQHS